MSFKNFFHKFYIDNWGNKIIVVSFLSLIVLNITGILRAQNTFNETANIISIICTVMPYVLLFFKKIPEDHTYKEQESLRTKVFAGPLNFKELDKLGEKDLNYNNTIDYLGENAVLIKRAQHRNNIQERIIKLFELQKNQNRTFVITGDSGAGKSFIINYLKYDLRKKGYDVYIKRDNYNILQINLCDSKKQIIFLDHFEKALNYTSFINNLKEYYDSHNCVVVFSFPQEYLSSTQNYILNGMEVLPDNIYTLSLNEEDYNDYIFKIAHFASSTDEVKLRLHEIETGNYTDLKSFVDIMCYELIKVKRGQAPLIELELIGHILSYDFGEIKIISKSNTFIDLYLDNWVNQFKEKELAYTILYLLADNQSYNIEDLKLATFEDGESFAAYFNSESYGKYIHLLQNNPFIHVSTTVNNVLTFEPVHNYVIELIKDYCISKNIPEGTKYYLEYLRKCIKQKNNNIQKYKKLYSKIKMRYNNYHKPQPLLFGSLITMCVLMFLINLYYLKQNVDISIYYQLLWNSIVSMPAIYYIYNYCNLFFKIQNDIWVKLTCIYGNIVIVLSYVCINFWGILMGSEIIMLSLCIFFSLTRHTFQLAKKKFLKDCGVFSAIGVVVVLLGIIFALIFRNNDMFIEYDYRAILLKYSYYVEFAIYAILAILGHDNYNYMIGRIGFANIIEPIEIN